MSIIKAIKDRRKKNAVTIKEIIRLVRQIQEKESDMEAIERSWGNTVQASIHKFNASEMQGFLESLDRYQQMVLDKKISA